MTAATANPPRERIPLCLFTLSSPLSPVRPGGFEWSQFPIENMRDPKSRNASRQAVFVPGLSLRVRSTSTPSPGSMG